MAVNSTHVTKNGEEPLTLLAPMESITPRCDVCIIGAGPSGLMLASNLVRFGVKINVVDERPDRTTVGRADGLQPKTLETLQMMRLGYQLERLGTRVFDICMWSTNDAGELQRMGREVHYPPAAVDLLEPYILLCHQGMVEGLFLDDLRSRGVEVVRSTKFDAYSSRGDGVAGSMLVHCKYNVTQDDRIIESDYLVGCDGAHSQVRCTIPDAFATGTPHNSVWGVLDGEVETDFPDIWSKTVVYSSQFGSVLIIPRERNLTRFYIEMKSSTTSKNLGQAFVMQRANEIIHPYRIQWKSVEWFGRYQVAQRVAPKFVDPHRRVFIAGDASHSHSPKAAQGMNTSVHDSWNLAWKLNLAIRGMDKHSVLLDSYEEERRKIAHDLINFDYEHANQIAAGDAQALAKNFLTNVRFISGVGVEYAPSILNQPVMSRGGTGGATPGCNLPPAKVTRYIDANPVDIQVDIPVLGQFKIYIFIPDVVAATASGFLPSLCSAMAESTSLISRLTVAASQSYAKKPRTHAPEDDYFRPERYTTISNIFTFALVAIADKGSFEIAGLPPVLAKSPWTIYLDDVAHLDTRKKSCTEKWVGGLRPGEAAIVNVRPDGYVGSINRWGTEGIAGETEGREAAAWLDSYYDGFLQVPE